uniref:Uncharacterized protein n=1 Tax=Anguilla anguilla TaxID=7936 RepID=A0A0E9VGU4_ANGAN
MEFRPGEGLGLDQPSSPTLPPSLQCD